MNDVLGLAKASENLSQPLTKLIEVCANGLGIVYEPVHIKRMAKAKAKEIDTISESMRENIELPIWYEDGHITIDGSSSEELTKRMRNRIEYQEIKKQKNIENVLSKAKNLLEDKTEVSNEDVDCDWISRFFNYVGEISNEQVQLLWGQILAGEISEPGTFSFKTLDILRNITNEEAELFRRIASYLLSTDDNERIIYNDSTVFKAMGVSLIDIVALGDIGLISQENLSLDFSIVEKASENPHLLYGNYIIMFKSEAQTVSLPIPLYKLTRAGKELLTIVNTEFKLELLISISKLLENKGINLYYSEITEIMNKKIKYKLPLISMRDL